MNEILKYEKEFSEDKFKSYVDNVFIQIHLALMTQNLDKIRHFVSESVYLKYEQKLKGLQEKNVKQIYDEINVKQTTIMDYYITDKMVIKVNITSRYMDYLIDNEGNFVSGVNTHRIEKENYLTFEKSIGSKEQGTVRKCPGCHASVNVNANGKCQYCGSIYNLKDYDWILTSIETV